MYKTDEVLGINHPSWTDWTWQQSNAIKNFASLRQKMPWLPADIEKTATHFQLQITPHYFSLLDLNNPEDPLAKICVPSLQELIWREDELVDPIGDRVNTPERNHSPTAALVHRYPDRCLLFLTPLCAAYCRYCFRREMVAKPENTFSADVIEASFDYIEKTPSIREVILSGGDPLLWSDAKLEIILKRLDKIPHIRGLRIHTRFPVFNPFRITPAFAQMLASLKKPVVMMIHTMHPREITSELQEALGRLRKAGIPLLNQSVLVKGCNDDVEVLKELSYRLNDCGVVPQYLHMLDLARGTSHFRVSIQKAQQLMRELRGRLSGFMIPQLMLEIPGGYGKISVESSMLQKYIDANGDVVYTLESPHLPGKFLQYTDSP